MDINEHETSSSNVKDIKRAASPLMRQKRLSSQTGLEPSTESAKTTEQEQHQNDKEDEDEVSELIKPHKAR